MLASLTGDIPLCYSMTRSARLSSESGTVIPSAFARAAAWNPRGRMRILFDQLIGANEKRQWHVSPKCLGALEIYKQIDPGGQLDGRSAGLVPLTIWLTYNGARWFIWR